MQDLLIKIIKMDEQARKTAEIAKAEKLKSEQEVEALREQIYNDYIKRAKERIEKNIAVVDDLAVSWLVKPQYGPAGCSLSAARLTYHSESLSLFDAECQVVKGLHYFPVLAETAAFDREMLLQMFNF